MESINAIRPVGVGISEDMNSKGVELPKRQSSSQKRSVGSSQIVSNTVQQRISETVSQFMESNDVHLDFEIHHSADKILVKVINNFSGEIVREIPVKPGLNMDRVTGAIFKTLA
jgi:uncharacterized FlaG/YvyC family protein